MKSIPITVQKVLAFIPLVNTIGIFVFVYQCAILRIDKKSFIKTLFLIFPTVLIFGIGMAMIDFIFGTNSAFYKFLSFASFYFFPAFVFLVIIYVQKKYLGDKL